MSEFIASEHQREINRHSVRKYRATNIEKVRASNRAGKEKARKQSPEKIAAQLAKWRSGPAGVAWLEKTKISRAAYNRDYNARHREWRREVGRRHYAKKHGLPAPLRPCPAACEICGKTQEGKRLALDHDHKTGRFRGWLCTPCNTAIGKLGDDLPGVLRAVEYLKRAAGE